MVRTKPNVKWNNDWLGKVDDNGAIIKTWCRNDTSVNFYCRWCASSVSFASQGLCALKQHAMTAGHKKLHDEIHDKTTPRIAPVTPSTSAPVSSGGFFQPVIGLQRSLADRTTDAEVIWMMKVASSDYSLNSCENLKETFHKMFNCDITKNKEFSLGRNKVSYCLSDGLGPLMLSNLCKDVSISEGGFTILFDETTNAKNKKQMDLLVRYWSEAAGEVTTGYLTSMMFGRCTHEQLKDKFMGLLDDPKFQDLPWDRFFNISSDGPHINTALYRVLNEALKKSGKHGLLPLFVCCLHIVHNAFHKGIDVFGQESEQLAFDLHAWFKQAPCKEEDYRELSEDVTIENESLFLRHLNTRWLTLVPALLRVKKRWEDARYYFLTFVKTKKEYKNSLPKNKKYARIEGSLKDEIKVKLQMCYLIEVAPVFTDFLLIFQGEGPLIHMLYYRLQKMLQTLMLRFLKADVVTNKDGKTLMTVDVRKAENQLDLEKMNVGVEVTKLLKKCRKDQKEGYLKEMQEAFCKMTEHLQNKLPLDSTFLKDMICLHPLKRTTMTSLSISRIAKQMPHIVSDDKISRIKDEWEVLKSEDDIKEDWFLNSDGKTLKRVDHYWNQVFKLKSLTGAQRYPYLAKIVKSCCALQNGNAAVERSLSDNKNTLTKERSLLGDETLKALRLTKEYVRRNGGAHQVVVTQEMRSSVRDAYSAYVARKKEEEKAALDLAAKKGAAEEEKKKQEAVLAEAEKKKGKLQKKEDSLAADEAEVDVKIGIARKLLKEGTERLTKAIARKDMEEVQAASALVESANKKLDAINKHREELSNVKKKLGKKRKALMDAVITVKKKKINKHFFL